MEDLGVDGDNIQMDLQEVAREGLDCVGLVQDRVVCLIMHFQVHIK